MTRVVVAPDSVASFPEGGGHFWVFLQWIRGLQRNGCDVHWLECVQPKYDRQPTTAWVDRFLANLGRVGLADRALVYRPTRDGGVEFVNVDDDVAFRALDDAELLVNFKYDTPHAILDRVPRTVLVDIDPGLLQFWMANGQIEIAPHDRYFTTAERVGTDRVPDCGLAWEYTRPVVDTASWTFDSEPRRNMFTTVTNWFGEWLTDGADFLLDNAKRGEFLRMIDLPRRTTQPLELAVCLGNKAEDDVDRNLLLDHGWRVRHSYEVSSDPFTYRRYIRSSRGEFSCVKPSCLLFQTAWISDRTLCYLASGRPAVVQHTGASAYLPDGDGLFRFTSIEDAVAALDAVNQRYEYHCQAARELVTAHFDAAAVSALLLDRAFAPVELTSAKR